MKIIDDDSLNTIRINKLILARRFVYFVGFSNFLYQISNIDKINAFFDGEFDNMESIIQLIYWVLWFILLILIILSLIKNQSQLIYIQIIILLVRNILSLLDFEDKRNTQNDSFKTSVFILFQQTTVTLLQSCLNFTLNSSVLRLISSLISMSLGILGTFVMFQHEKVSFMDIVGKVVKDS